MDRIIEILKEMLPKVDVENQTKLVDDRILTSINILKLVTTLQKEFDIEITPVDMLPENFNSAQAIYNLVKKLED